MADDLLLEHCATGDSQLIRDAAALNARISQGPVYHGAGPGKQPGLPVEEFGGDHVTLNEDKLNEGIINDQEKQVGWM